MPAPSNTNLEQPSSATVAKPVAPPANGETVRAAAHVALQRKLTGAAADFLYGLLTTALFIASAVWYCRRQKRKLRRMEIGRKKQSGPSPPPWPPGRPGVACNVTAKSARRFVSRTPSSWQRQIYEEVPLFSIAEDFGSSGSEEEVDDTSWPPQNSSYGSVPTVVVTDRSQRLHSVV